jgi:hypothetical protein
VNLFPRFHCLPFLGSHGVFRTLDDQSITDKTQTYLPELEKTGAKVFPAGPNW